MASGHPLQASTGRELSGPDQKTRLLEAARNNRVSEVRTILSDSRIIISQSDISNALREASASGTTAVVELLLAGDADVGYDPEMCQADVDFVRDHQSARRRDQMICGQISCGKTALQAAAEGGHVETVAMLLKANAGVNAEPSLFNGRTALQAAAGDGHTEIVLMLLDAGANIEAGPSVHSGRTALQAAAEGGHAGLVFILLETGADIDAPPAEVNGRTALQAAAANGHANILSILVKAGANINAVFSNGTLLQNAAESGNIVTVNMLIDQGADVNLPAPFGERTSRDSWVSTRRHALRPPQETWPLCIAAKRGHAAVVRLLLNHKADVDVGRPDKTAIRAAAQEGYSEVVKILLDCGADINACDTLGRTCLTWGISHPEVVQILLERGADTRLQSLDGATALHCAVRDCHVESTVLLLNAGASTESEDYENRKPLDIVLDLGASEISNNLLDLLMENGCDIGKRPASSWGKALDANSTDVVVISETPRAPNLKAAASDGDGSSTMTRKARGKYNFKIEILKSPEEPPSLDISGDSEFPVTRKLHLASDTKVLFPAVKVGGIRTSHFRRYEPLRNNAVAEWRWFLLDGAGTPSGAGHGLSNGKLVTTIDKQALLSCYVCFEFLLQAPDGPEQKNSETLGKIFKTEKRASEISWTMRKPCVNPDEAGKGDTDTDPKPIFRSEDFRSTLDNGWIPESGLDFFTLFVVDLHKKWRILFEQADEHLATNRKMLLRKKGKTTSFIDSLLLDAQRWSNFRALLQNHVRKARDLVRDFKEKQYLCDEVSQRNREKGQKRGKSARELAILRLSKTIQRMETEAENEIKKLDEKTNKMIELEFNLVSIYEARTSKIMGMSMKRLSWITFIFLPLMFVASLFGMNVDLINGGPDWWWVAVLGIFVFVLVLSVWALLKIFRIEEWSQNQSSAAIAEKLEIHSKSLGRGWRKITGRSRLADAELGEVIAEEEHEFKTPPRQWTKLKEV